MTVIPIFDATAAIAWTAGSDEVPMRIEQLERMRAALVQLDRTIADYITNARLQQAA